VLGQVIVDNQSVLAIIAEVFADRASGERCEILEGVCVRGSRYDDRSVFHCTKLGKSLNNSSNVGHLLSADNIDAVNGLATVDVSRLLVDDRVNTNGRLSSLSVADNEFSLTSSNWDHRVNRFDTSLERLGNRLSFDNAGSDDFESTKLVAMDWALAVDGLTERVYDASEHSSSDGNLHDSTGVLDGVAFFDQRVVAKENRTNGVFFQVKCEAHDTIRELQEFSHLAVGQTVNASDTVAHLDNGAYVFRINRFFKTVELLTEDIGNFFWSNAGH
jgi:hypothetical protein